MITAPLFSRPELLKNVLDQQVVIKVIRLRRSFFFSFFEFKELSSV